MTTKSLKQATRQYPTPALEKRPVHLPANQEGSVRVTLPVASVALSQRYFEMLLCLEERGYISQSRDGERYRGYEERASYEVDGVINIPVPVLDDRGRAIAALTVPFLQRIGDQTTPATVREVLQKASVLLSESITAEAAS